MSQESDNSLIAAIEGDYSKMSHADLVLTCNMLVRGRAAWRKEAEDFKAQLEQSEKACAEMRKALRAIQPNINVHSDEAVELWSKALSTDCGKGYVNVEQLKQAQEQLAQRWHPAEDLKAAARVLQYNGSYPVQDKWNEALATFRKYGLLP